MTNFKSFILAALCALLLTSAAWARVCFLPGGEEDSEFCLMSYDGLGMQNCPDKYRCDHPKKGASICTEIDSFSYVGLNECCSDTNAYEVCEGNKTCESGHECLATDNYKSCKVGHCKCPSNYKLCNGTGQTGTGTACTDSEGTKYTQCKCSNEYYNCSSPATGSGGTCQDDTRGTMYKTCSCPASGDWATDQSTCTCGTTSECVSQPGNVHHYQCNSIPTYTCKCGYTYRTGFGGCPSGCTDSSYTYTGTIPTGVVCSTQINGIGNNVCGNNCKCAPKYWDKTGCNYPDCATLGYRQTSCSGDWIACPFDPSKKKCLN